MEAQGSELLLDLGRDDLGRPVLIGFPLQLRAELVDKVVPAVASLDAPAHGGFGHRQHPLLEDQRVAVVELFLQIGVHQAFSIEAGAPERTGHHCPSGWGSTRSNSSG